jgi:hypothetical protein
MALRATNRMKTLQPCGVKASALPPGLESPLGVRAFCPARSWHFRRSRIQRNEHGAAVNARLHSPHLRIRGWTQDTIFKRDWKDLEVRPLYCKCF